MATLVTSLLHRLGGPLAVLAAMTVNPAQASLNWNWSYSGDGITADGRFITDDTPDALGFYLITSITGTRNGTAITALQPTGTPIPGNEPFAVDNLVGLDGPQLTHNGFGYAIAGGTYANPFFADFLDPARYLEFFSAPPFTGGSGTEDSELPISFSATLTTIPEPGTWTLVFIGLGMPGAASRAMRSTHPPYSPRSLAAVSRTFRA